jgi:hypothetical protein
MCSNAWSGKSFQAICPSYKIAHPTLNHTMDRSPMMYITVIYTNYINTSVNISQHSLNSRTKFKHGLVGSVKHDKVQ